MPLIHKTRIQQMCAWIIGSESIMLLARDTKQHTAPTRQARLPRQTTSRIVERQGYSFYKHDIQHFTISYCNVCSFTPV